MTRGALIGFATGVLLFVFYFIDDLLRHVRPLYKPFWREYPRGLFWLVVLMSLVALGAIAGSAIATPATESIARGLTWQVAFRPATAEKRKWRSALVAAVLGALSGFVCVFYLWIAESSRVLTGTLTPFRFEMERVARLILDGTLAGGALGGTAGLVIGAAVAVLVPSRRLTGGLIGMTVGTAIGVAGAGVHSGIGPFAVGSLFACEALAITVVTVSARVIGALTWNAGGKDPDIGAIA